MLTLWARLWPISEHSTYAFKLTNILVMMTSQMLLIIGSSLRWPWQNWLQLTEVSTCLTLVILRMSIELGAPRTIQLISRTLSIQPRQRVHLTLISRFKHWIRQNYLNRYWAKIGKRSTSLSNKPPMSPIFQAATKTRSSLCFKRAFALLRLRMTFRPVLSILMLQIAHMIKKHSPNIVMSGVSMLKMSVVHRWHHILTLRNTKNSQK